MKTFRLTRFMAVAATIALLISCKESDDAPQLNVSSPELEFAGTSAEKQTVGVETNVNRWNVNSSAPEWLILGDKGSATFSVSVTDNPLPKERSGKITVTAGEADPVTISVVQLAGETLVEIGSLDLEFEGTDAKKQTITVTTNADAWEVTQSGYDWITISDKTTGAFSISVKDNPLASERKGEITVAVNGAEPITISVVQLAGPTVLDVAPGDLEFASSSATKQTVTVTTNAESWEATHSEYDWIVISDKAAGGFSVSATDNPSWARTGKITVTSGDAKPVVLTVTQLSSIQGDILVALDGSGDFTKIQDAINSVPDNKSTRTLIFLKKGIYNTEKLIVPSGKNNITLLGEDREQTIISYHMYSCSNAASRNQCPAESWELWRHDANLVKYPSTLSLYGEGFVAENLTIENSAGPVGQAQAVFIAGDKNTFLNCIIKGYQDTLYVQKAGRRSYFENCLVIGRTDYIYGGGIAFFEACEIRSFGGGYITAPETPEGQAYGFVFHNCQLTYTDGSPRPGDDGSKFALGRPWGDYPKVAWLECEISGMLNPLGWPTKWNMSYADTDTRLHLYEYNNTGPGADMSGRSKWAGLKALTADEAAKYTAVSVLGYDPTLIR